MRHDASAERHLRGGLRDRRPSGGRTRRPTPADGEPLPERVDVAVIGTGYCGLSGALELARAGIRVAALDAGALGAGASTRNGGMVGGAVKLDWQDLAKRFGRGAGRRAARTARAPRSSISRA